MLRGAYPVSFVAGGHIDAGFWLSDWGDFSITVDGWELVECSHGRRHRYEYRETVDYNPLTIPERDHQLIEAWVAAGPDSAEGMGAAHTLFADLRRRLLHHGWVDPCEEGSPDADQPSPD